MVFVMLASLKVESEVGVGDLSVDWCIFAHIL